MKVDNNHKVINNKLLLRDEGGPDNKSVVRGNWTTDEAVTYSKTLNNYIENPGFPDFVEAI